MKSLNIIVTAGGVTEKIDSIRKITNSSSGKLGIKIANALSRKYPTSKITIIGSKQAFKDNVLEPHCIENGEMKCVTIESTADLEREVTLRLTKEHVDIFIHSMAVADYTTESVIDFDKFSEIIANGCTNINEAIEKSIIDTSSKMSSSLNMMIKMKQTPKIIHLIKNLSPKTFLVGFKLLDNVTEDNLFNIGFDLLRKNKCNLVVANDIANIRQGNHEALIIYPEKSYDKVNGKDNIAERLVELIDKRAFVGHPKSICINTNNNINENTNVYIEMKNTGERLFKKGYLPEVVNHNRTDKIGTYGNISINTHDNGMFITGRNVHKGQLKPQDLCHISQVDTHISCDGVYAEVMYKGELKPSIDTAIHSNIYKITKGHAIIHIHTDKIFLGYPYIDEQFPCGSMEEKDAIISALKRGSKYLFSENENTQVIQMQKHGLIIVGSDLKTCEDKLDELFNNTPYIQYELCTDEEVLNHIEEVDATFVNKNNLYNLMYKDDIIGCIWEHNDENNIEFGIFTKLNSPKGLHIVENYLKLYDKSYFLYTTKDCNIADFYREKYNFIDVCEINNIIILGKLKRK